MWKAFVACLVGCKNAHAHTVVSFASHPVGPIEGNVVTFYSCRFRPRVFATGQVVCRQISGPTDRSPFASLRARARTRPNVRKDLQRLRHDALMFDSHKHAFNYDDQITRCKMQCMLVCCLPPLSSHRRKPCLLSDRDSSSF